MYARGAIVGITRGTTQNHIIRAALESIAYQSADLDAGHGEGHRHHHQPLKVDGGASVTNFLMQFQSDILERWRCPAIRETTALVRLIWPRPRHLVIEESTFARPCGSCSWWTSTASATAST